MEGMNRVHLAVMSWGQKQGYGRTLRLGVSQSEWESWVEMG